MAKHSDLYPLILPEVPGCPLPTVDISLNRAARELCTRGLAWREQAWPIHVRPGAYRYTIDSDDGADVVVVNAARFNGALLKATVDARGRVPFGQGSGQPGTYAIAPDACQILLVPTPSEAGLLSLDVALRPALRATSLPDVLVNRFEEALIEGAKALILRMPGQTWTDPNGAGMARLIFERHIGDARIEAETGRIVGSLRVTPRAFGSAV